MFQVSDQTIPIADNMSAAGSPAGLPATRNWHKPLNVSRENEKIFSAILEYEIDNYFR
jgi:hypothetical protein